MDKSIHLTDHHVFHEVKGDINAVNVCEDQMVQYMWMYFVYSILQYTKYYYMKRTEASLFFHKSMIYLGIMSSKTLKMSIKKSVLFFLNQY